VFTFDRILADILRPVENRKLKFAYFNTVSVIVTVVIMQNVITSGESADIYIYSFQSSRLHV